MEKIVTEAKSLRFSDIHGVRSGFLLFSLPILAMLGLCIYSTVGCIQGWEGNYLANAILFGILAVLFCFPELFFVFLPNKDLIKECGTPVYAQIVDTSEGFIHVVYRNNGKLLQGRLSGCFIMAFTNLPLYRGEAIEAMATTSNQIILLSSKGRKKFFKEEKADSDMDASDCRGLKMRLFLSSLPYDFFLLIGIVSLIFSFIIDESNPSKFILMFLGLLVMIPSLFGLIHTMVHTQKELTRHISRPGIKLKAKLVAADKNVYDCLFKDDAGQLERAPLVILSGARKLDRNKEYDVFINDKNEAFLLNPEEK